MLITMQVAIKAEDDLDYDAGTELGFIYEELQALIDEFIDQYGDNVTAEIRRLDD